MKIEAESIFRRGPERLGTDTAEDLQEHPFAAEILSIREEVNTQIEAENRSRQLLDANEWARALREWQPGQLADPDAPLNYVVDGWIQYRKVGALVAAGGTGKTTLTLTLSICGAIKRKFMGLTVAHGTYVILSSDDSQEDLDGAFARVIRDMGLTDDEIELARQKVRIHSLQGLGGTKTFAAVVGNTVTETGLQDIIIEALKGVEDLRLLTLDTLRQFSGGNSNDEQVVKLTISAGNEIAQALSCAVMIMHHVGKSNYRDGISDMYAGTGSAAIGDNCRFVLLLQTTTWSDIESKVKRTGQEEGDPLVLTSTRGSLLVKAPAPVFMHRTGFLIDKVDGAVMTQDQMLDDRDRRVLGAIRSGAQTKNAIFQAVRGNRKAILDCIDDLETRGHIENDTEIGTNSRPIFKVTASGSKLLNGGL